MMKAWPTSFLAVFLIARCAAEEPRVAFGLKDGWVELALKQAGKPAAGSIKVLDERGREFAEGETGDEGQTAFPLPRGASFLLEIKTGPRTADPIRLFKTDAGLEPDRVLLSYGLRPCCRFLARSVTEPIEPPAESPPPSDALPDELWLGAGIAGLFSAAVVLVMVQRRRWSARG